MNLKAIYEMWSWTCAVRFNADGETSILNDRESKFTIVPNSDKYWCADPFLFKKDGELYLFFEAFDILKRKGLLGCRKIEEGNFGDIHIIYEYSSHLSYPFIYEVGGNIYIIPESSKSGELIRLKCVNFPYEWELDKKLLKENLVDSVRLKIDGKEYLISEIVDDTHVYDRVDLYSFEDGKLLPSKNNPVKRDVTSARGAGAICKIGGRLIRPAQNCKDSYGEKLTFNEIESIDKNSLSERVAARFTFRDIKTDSNTEFDGIHTYGKLDNTEVVDLRIPGKFNLKYTLGFANKVKEKLFKR